MNLKLPKIFFGGFFMLTVGLFWIPSLWDIFMVGIRAVPVRAAVSHLLSLNESLRNKFLESHLRISYHTALTPTIESQGTPSFFIESMFSKPSNVKK